MNLSKFLLTFLKKRNGLQKNCTIKYLSTILKSYPQKCSIFFEAATKEKKLKILNNHPKLANKTKISLLTSDSLKEQNNARLDQCTKNEFNEFKKLNDAYKKFGFPFILAVKGKTKIEILDNFRKRISSDPEIEFSEAVKQVKQIANFRLKELSSKAF